MHTETVFHKNELFSSLYLSESAETNEKQGYIGLFEDSRCNTEKTHIQKLESNSAFCFAYKYENTNNRKHIYGINIFFSP